MILKQCYSERDYQLRIREINAELKITLFKQDAQVDISKPKKSYSGSQRGALHVWCGMCAEVLNGADIYRKRKAVFGDGEIEMPWCMESFKQDVYKYVLEAMTGKTSTEDQSSVNPSDVAIVISKQYSENGLICPPWPSNR